MMTLKEVAAASGNSYYTVARYARERGWSKRGSKGVLDEAQEKEILEALKQSRRGKKNEVPQKDEGCDLFGNRNNHCFMYKEIDCPRRKECLAERNRTEGMVLVDDPDSGCLLANYEDTVTVDGVTRIKPNTRLVDLSAPVVPTEGAKHDAGKPRMELLPMVELREVAEVLTFGAGKYEDDNWKKVPDGAKRYTGALLRHLSAWQSGEKLDSESGMPHLAHVTCNALFLQWFEKEKREE
jgi:hypothetical protein